MSSNRPLSPEPLPTIDPAYHVRTFSDVQEEPPILSRWYSFTAPALPSPSAPLAEREKARRGRLLSLLVLLITAVVLLAIPVAIYTKNPSMLASLSFALVFNVITLLFNRRGLVTIAGLLTVIPMLIGFAAGQISTPGGITIDNVRIFDLLVASDLLVVSIFNPVSVFIIVGINSVLIWAVISFVPHNAELDPFLTSNRYGLILLPILMQLVVALPAYLLVRSTYHALRRADRAEELATLIQQNLMLQQREIERTRQIEQGTDLILATLVRFANGDIMAQAPESQENVLWKIGRSINTLLARQRDYQRKTLELEQARKQIDELQTHLQRHMSTQNELQRTKEAAARLQSALAKARKQRTRMVLPPPNGTMIDEITTELQAMQS